MKFAFGIQRNLRSTDLRWGFALGETQILGLASGVMEILAFLDTNVLVYPTQNCGIWGLSHLQDPRPMVSRHSGISRHSEDIFLTFCVLYCTNGTRVKRTVLYCQIRFNWQACVWKGLLMRHILSLGACPPWPVPVNAVH